MANKVLVRFEIPIVCDWIVDTPALIFTHWLPLAENDFIVIHRDDMTIKFWFDKGCLGHVMTVDDVADHVNVLVDKIFIDVLLNDLPSEFIDYIEQSASSPSPPSGPYRQVYADLGERVYLLSLSYLNKLIAYVRSQKGQYWLHEYPIDVGMMYSQNNHFKAEVLINGKWIRWKPSDETVIRSRGGFCHEKSRFLDQDAWAKARNFVISQRRTSLVWELLAGAEWLAV